MLRLLQFLMPKKERKSANMLAGRLQANIQAETGLAITEIHNVEILKTLGLDEFDADELKSLAQRGDIEAIKKLPGGGNLFEDLTIVQFASQDGTKYIAIIYDSYNAWEEPVVVDAFKLLDWDKKGDAPQA